MVNRKSCLQFLVLMVLIGLSIGMVSCKKNEGASSFEEEMQLLAEYIQNNGITVTPTASGLYYIEIETGTGNLPQPSDYVNVKYTGRLLDGSVFDSGTFGFTLGVGQVIPGWDEGISYMRQGGKAQLIIPSNLGYGASGSRNIPGYSTLIFDVELITHY